MDISKLCYFLLTGASLLIAGSERAFDISSLLNSPSIIRCNVNIIGDSAVEETIVGHTPWLFIALRSQVLEEYFPGSEEVNDEITKSSQL